MTSIKTIIIKIFQGTAVITASSVLPLAAYLLTLSPVIVIIVYLVQTGLIAVMFIRLNKRVTNWVWLIIVASSAIIFSPILSSHAQYLYYSIFPLLGQEIDSTSIRFMRTGLPRFYIAKGAVIDTGKEIWYRESEEYELEDRNNPGRYQKKTSTTESHFVPLSWRESGAEDSFGVLEYNSQVKEALEKSKYNRLQEELPALFLLAGASALMDEAKKTYARSDPAPSFKLSSDAKVFNHVFLSENDLRGFIREKLPLPIIFFLVLWIGFVAVPAYMLSKKE